MTDAQPYCVNVDSPISVFVQIENQIRFAIVSGRLKSGERIPPVLHMAEILGVNTNTVGKAYRDLQVMGLVCTRRGVGMVVAEKAAASCGAATMAMVKNHLLDAVAECISTGLTAAEINKTVAQTIESGVGPYRSAKRK